MLINIHQYTEKSEWAESPTSGSTMNITPISIEFMFDDGTNSTITTPTTATTTTTVVHHLLPTLPYPLACLILPQPDLT